MQGGPGQASIGERSYLEVSPKSRAAFERVQPLIPGGAPGGVAFHLPYPLTFTRGEGCHVWDTDGRKMLDLMQGDWLMPLGHGNPAVRAAIMAQFDRGTTFGAADPDLGFQMATLLQSRLPSLERMRFCTSGTEADHSAMRLARAFTGRGKIGKMHGAYHGMADAALVGNGTHPDPGYLPAGLAPHTAENVVLLPFNDLDACEKIIEREHADLACVIVEPVMGVCGTLPGTREFLHGLRAVTERHGIVLIFDEVVTFPMGPHGAQGYYGVRPDLTTMGKAIGGGLPLGAFGGRADIMALTDPLLHKGMAPVRFASTFGGIPICLAAGIAAIQQLTPEVHRHLNALGDYAREGIAALAKRMDVPLQVTGVGHFFGLQWSREKVIDYRTRLISDAAKIRSIVLSLQAKGFYLFSFGVAALSTPMTEKDLDRFLAGLEAAIREHGEGA